VYSSLLEEVHSFFCRLIWFHPPLSPPQLTIRQISPLSFTLFHSVYVVTSRGARIDPGYTIAQKHNVLPCVVPGGKMLLSVVKVLKTVHLCNKPSLT
jgi:hypothetical protein